MPRRSAESIYITDIPVQPTDDPITRIMKRIGAPSLSLPAADYNRMRRPILYMWEREGKPLYIGISVNGVARPFGFHHVLSRMKPTDNLYVWSFSTEFALKTVEAELIREFAPELNTAGKPAGSPRRQFPTHYEFRMAEKRRLEDRVEYFKTSLAQAKKQLNEIEIELRGFDPRAGVQRPN